MPGTSPECRRPRRRFRTGSPIARVLKEHRRKVKSDGWPPGARRHVNRMLRALAPRADHTGSRLAALLRKGYIPARRRSSRCWRLRRPPRRAPGGWTHFSHSRTYWAGTRRLGVTPGQATEALREFDPLLETRAGRPVSAGAGAIPTRHGFRPLPGFYEAREGEVRRLAIRGAARRGAGAPPHRPRAAR